MIPVESHHYSLAFIKEAGVSIIIFFLRQLSLTRFSVQQDGLSKLPDNVVLYLPFNHQRL